VSLLLPVGLVALVALPVIVLLHMRHTAPRPKPIPALRFWLAARPEQTQQTRLRRPPISLLLLLQLLAAAALALALARPAVAGALGALGLDLQTEPRHLILLLDGSTSMAAEGEAAGRTRYDEARTDALGRLAELADGDVATVLLLGTRVSTLSATDAVGFGELRDRLAATPLPGGRADLDAALALARDLLLPGRDNEIAVLSDGAVAADPATVAALGAPVEFRRFGGAGGDANAAVVSVAARATGGDGGGNLYARLANFGPEPLTAPVLLLADGIEAGRQEVSLPADGGAVELSWPLPPGASEASVLLEADDALLADNRADLPLAGGDLSLRILHVSDVPSPLARVLGAIEGAGVTSEPGERLNDPAGLGTFDLVVLEGVAPPPGALEELQAPLLIVAPPPGGPLPTDGVMVEPEIERLRAGDPLLEGVDLSGVTFGETPIVAADAAQQEVVGAAEGPLVLRTAIEGESAVVLAFDPAGSNLPRRVAFPILIANAVAELAPAPLPQTVALGEPLRVQPRAGTAEVEIAPPTGDPVTLAFDPADGGTPRDAVFAATGQPGGYDVVERDAAGTETGGGRFVVNAGHPRESDLRPTPDLAETLAAAEGSLAGPARGPGLADLWPPLALAALALLLLEWLVALLPRRRLVPAAVGAARSGSGRGRR